MSDMQTCQFGNEFAPWQTGAAFNAYWSYSYINNSIFYSMIPAYYRPFMQRQVQVWDWWGAGGWCPYFHNPDKGILSSRVGVSLVRKTAKKVIGSRIMFKNVGAVKDNVGENASRAAILAWSSKTNFEKAVKSCIEHAATLGTACLKLNKDINGELWGEAVSFNRFLPTVDAATGKVRQIQFYLMTSVDESKTANDNTFNTVYNLVERRYFGDFTHIDGKVSKGVPIVEYGVYRATGNVNLGTFTMTGTPEKLQWQSLPSFVRDAIVENYGSLQLNKPVALPFKDLGCQIVTWTNGVSGYPGLPFGESAIANIIPFLQEYDYLVSEIGTEMYLSRGRVMVPQGLQGKNDGWDSGLNDMMYKLIPYVNPEEQKPVPVQFELRSEALSKMRNTIVESIAINMGLSPSTVAAFLNDSSARTAREVSTEENETACYVADTRAILETPINRIIEEVCRYYGLEDKIEMRWSQANLSNPFITSEMVSTQYQAGLISLKDAITMLNPDDDEPQIDKRVTQAKADFESKQLGSAIFDDSDKGDYYGSEGDAVNVEAQTEPTGDFT